METATAVPERRLYEVERQELAEEIVRGLHTCHECGDRFVSATEWINHTTPVCKQAQRKREDDTKRERKRKTANEAEAQFAEAFGKLVDEIGLFHAVEAMGRCCENWNEDRRWDDVSQKFFILSEEIDREGYDLER